MEKLILKIHTIFQDSMHFCAMLKGQVSEKVVNRPRAAMDITKEIISMATKFSEWKDNNTMTVYDWEPEDKIIFYTIAGVPAAFSMDQLFDYFINNVYENQLQLQEIVQKWEPKDRLLPGGISTME